QAAAKVTESECICRTFRPNHQRKLSGPDDLLWRGYVAKRDPRVRDGPRSTIGRQTQRLNSLFDELVATLRFGGVDAQALPVRAVVDSALDNKGGTRAGAAVMCGRGHRRRLRCDLHRTKT